MTEMDQYRSDARFVGVTGLLVSLAFGLVSASNWVTATMLTATGYTYLLRPYKVRRWRVLLGFLLGGLAATLGSFYLRDRGMLF